MRFCVLASGSKGNSTYVEAGGTRLLIDAGLSARRLADMLALIDVEADSIDGVFVTHEHIDHVRGLDVWCKRHGTKVYMTMATHEAFNTGEHSHVKVEHFQPGTPLKIGSIKLTPFNVTHDAAETVGVTLESNGHRMGIATDLGCTTALVRQRLMGLDAVVIESNHDPKMLMEGPYPWPVKDRIRRNHGHLSNAQSARLLRDLAHPGLKTVALAHLSEINNRPEIALETAARAIDGKSGAALCVGRQHSPTELFTL